MFESVFMNFKENSKIIHSPSFIPVETLIGWDMVLSWLREFSDTACMVVMDNLRGPMFHSVLEKGNDVYNASKTHKVS